MSDNSIRLELVENLQPLRALARRLTRDVESAEDAVQDTVVAALGAAGPTGSVRGWLRTILRNAIRAAARSARRREQRELAVRPGTESAHATPEVALELQTQRRLLQLVQELDDPLRQVLFLRFWRDLAPRVIAERLGVPVKSVHAWIERGLSRLRTRLDAEPGGRAEWRAALFAFGAGARRGLLATTGVLLMQAKVVLVVVVATLSLFLGVLFWLPDSGSAATTGVASSGDVAVVSPGGTDGAPTTTRERHPLATAEPIPPAAVPGPDTELVRGVAHDVDGRPVAALAIGFARQQGELALERDPSVPVVTTAADGTFAVPRPSGVGCFQPVDRAWSAILRPWLSASPSQQPLVLIVARSRSYAGTVLDPAGAPAARARVMIVVGQGYVPTLRSGGQTVALPHGLGTTDTDAQGRFAFDAVGFVPGARVLASLAPYHGAELPLPEASTPDLLLRLEPSPVGEFVHGVVLDARGAPIADALVAAAGRAVHSAADGRFAAPWAYGRRPSSVSATHPAHGAVQVGLSADVASGWQVDQPITLVLPGQHGAVAGRVVDAAGSPVAGVRVWTPDLTWFGEARRERLGRDVLGPTSVEELAAPTGQWLEVATTSDRDGAFALRGLLPRPYALFALASDTLNGAGPIWASPGERIEIRLPATERRRVAGRVRSADGQPLAGVQIGVGRTMAWQRPERQPDPWHGSPMAAGSSSHVFGNGGVTTDRDGRFAFAGLVVDGAMLSFRGEALLLPAPLALAAVDDLEQLDVVLPVRSSFRIVLDRPDEADAVKITNAAGGPVTVLVRVEGFEMSMGEISINSGQSPEASAQAGEVVVVLLRRGVEVRRVVVRLPAGGVHDLRI
ncbi:MAG: sigma-70 family RNA polymerase sigma factor [Planctomycetes bacterium]|nr:sigma-70 family RNA polymerase sigma factor [Planctomycetota bacterium]